METVTLVVFVVLLVLAALLPQLPGLALFHLLRNRSIKWARAIAILLPPLLFFAPMYAFIKHEEATQAPTEYFMVIGFWFLLLYGYLAFGIALNLVCGIAIQLMLIRRSSKAKVKLAGYEE